MLREQIVIDVLEKLKNAQDPAFGLVSREPFETTQLSRQQFPALYITTADEVREDLTQNGKNGLRTSSLAIRIIGYVSGTQIDTLRNDLIERVEEILDDDRTRGGIARSTQLKEVFVDYNIISPMGRVELVIEVIYNYRRGIA